ncbi:hypothetical protein IQ06DRAFT_298862 [Phaeosphaeriaceae sp. SRC1lsM3a]|nr:hypothetical protein IQ06DRAFT_298862 [Stagonospora sp. SRC1lsM3a]
MVRAVIVVLGMLGAAVAQYNGPAFNPDTAPHFGPVGLVDPAQTYTVPVAVPTLSDAVPTTIVTPTFIASRISSVFASASGSAIVSGSVTLSGSASPSTLASVSQSRNATMVSSSSVAASSSASLSSSFSTSASRTSSATSSATAPAQSTGAAVANVPGMVGAIAGGLFAGLAML